MTMTEITSSPTAEAVERYLRFWNSGAGDEQQRLAPSVFRDDVSYHAPIGEWVGVDGVLTLGRQFAEHLGEVAFRARTTPDVHHDRARLQWELFRAGESFAEGTDVLVIDEQGRVRSVTSFLDRAPEGFDPHAHD
jgi:hypothetical protein